MKSRSIFILSVALLTASIVYAEEITLKTIMPNQSILRAKKGAIGEKYGDQAQTGDDVIGNDNLLVEGNIGIGTKSPQAKLDLRGNQIIYNDNSTGTSNGQFNIYGATTTSKQLWVALDTTNNYGAIQSYLQGYGGLPLLLNPGGGNVGIGTTTPQVLLTVDAKTLGTFPCWFTSDHDAGTAVMINNTNTNDTGNVCLLFNRSHNNFYWNIGSQGDNNNFYIATPDAVCMWITKSDYKVHFKVAHADYVFNTGYNLMPLNKLEEYIVENKKLPGMTKEEGMDGSVNDLLKKHTEKIEELTLYIIAQDKKIKELEKKLSK